ncbi:MAG TPA: hypothetical protein VGC41_14030 [Kofleriaceae bacterium]
MKFKINQRLPSSPGDDVVTPIVVATERVRPGRFLTPEQVAEREAARDRFRASMKPQGTIE